MRPTFTETNKNIGTFLSKVLMSPSCIKEDAQQKNSGKREDFKNLLLNTKSEVSFFRTKMTEN